MTTIGRFLVVHIFLLSYGYCYGEIGRSCRIARNEGSTISGTCIEGKLCPNFWNLVNKQFLSKAEDKLLDALEAACDGDLIVCCEQLANDPTTTTTTPQPTTKPTTKPTKKKKLIPTTGMVRMITKATTAASVPTTERINPGEVDPRTLLPDLRHCGTHGPSNKIINGYEPELEEHRWAVFLNITEANEGRCGGTLISHRYVLTAAHCLNNLKLKDLTLHLGEHNLTSDPDCESCLPVIRAQAEKFIIHEGYNNVTKEHDIALIRLDKEYKNHDHIYPICMELNELAYENQNFSSEFTVLGWGDTGTAVLSDVRMIASVAEFALEDCIESYYGWSAVKISSNNICAIGKDEQDSCSGDSGGPLMYEKEGIWYLIGAVNYGRGCPATNELPGVYIRVTSYIDWILSNLET